MAPITVPTKRDTPKAVKKKRAKPTRRPADPNLWAHQLVDESIAEPTEASNIPPAALSAYMSALERGREDNLRSPNLLVDAEAGKKAA